MMVLKYAGICVFVGLATTAIASAQTSISNQSQQKAQPLRIVVGIQTNTPLPAGGGDQISLTQEARQKIYISAAAECFLLSTSFKADCRMIALNVNSSVADRGGGIQSITANGNATYELLPRDQ